MRPPTATATTLHLHDHQMLRWKLYDHRTRVVLRKAAVASLVNAAESIWFVMAASSVANADQRIQPQ
jgi:hypothetical protein